MRGPEFCAFACGRNVTEVIDDTVVYGPNAARDRILSGCADNRRPRLQERRRKRDLQTPSFSSFLLPPNPKCAQTAPADVRLYVLGFPAEVQMALP